MDGFPILPILLILYVVAVSGSKRKKKNRPQKKSTRAATRAPKHEEHTDRSAQGFAAAFEQSAPIPEGEDRCHPAPERKQARAAEPEPEAAPGDLAQDVLRGVIMSEILTRPCERRARNRQGYHG